MGDHRFHGGPQGLKSTIWLRAAILAELQGSPAFVADIAASVEEAEQLIKAGSNGNPERLFARFTGWRLARREGIRIPMVLSERIAQIAALILE